MWEINDRPPQARSTYRSHYHLQGLNKMATTPSFFKDDLSLNFGILQGMPDL